MSKEMREQIDRFKSVLSLRKDISTSSSLILYKDASFRKLFNVVSINFCIFITID